MAFQKKTWLNRISDYPNRRLFTKMDSSQEVVTVTRNEGNVSQEGDSFSAENMNDLETRIEEVLGGASFSIEGDKAYISYEVNGVTYKKALNDIAVDTALSDSSTNPVRNSTIKAALDTKANATALGTQYTITYSNGVLTFTPK